MLWVSAGCSFHIRVSKVYFVGLACCTISLWVLVSPQAIVDQQLGKAGETALGLLDQLLLTSGQFGGVTSENAHLWQEDQANILLKTPVGAAVTPLSLKVKACSPSVFG